MIFNVLEVLVLFVTSVLTIWYLRFLWKRRKMYIYSWNVPGPFSLPFIGIIYKFIGRFDDFINGLVNIITEYPSVAKIWLGPHLIYSLKGPEDVRKVLTNSKCLEKGFIYKLLADHIGTGLLTAPVPKWKKHRKIVRPAFSQTVLDSFVEVFVEQATIFCKVLQKHTRQKDIDVSDYVNPMMMDAIGETALGLKLNTQGGNTEFKDNFDRGLELITLQLCQVWYHVEWIWKLSPLGRELNKRAEFFTNYILEVVKKKKQALGGKEMKGKALPAMYNEKGGDIKKVAFLDVILENPECSEEEIVEEVMIFFVGGMDTSASTTCFCFEMLGMHPEVQRMVYEEVIEVAGDERPVETSDLPRLKYLERVLKETLRLFPVAVFIMRSMEEDVDLGHYIIPEGASIMLSILNIHRDPEHWPDPLKFDPDRFLPEEVAKRPPCSYIPFSYGPRNCIGNTYAMMSMKSIVATTTRKYRVFSGYESVEEIKLKTSFLSRPKYGFKVYMENR